MLISRHTRNPNKVVLYVAFSPPFIKFLFEFHQFVSIWSLWFLAKTLLRLTELVVSLKHHHKVHGPGNLNFGQLARGDLMLGLGQP